MTFSSQAQSQPHRQPQVRVPEEAGEYRIGLAAVTDGFLVLFVGSAPCLSGEVSPSSSSIDRYSS